MGQAGANGLGSRWPVNGILTFSLSFSVFDIHYWINLVNLQNS